MAVVIPLAFAAAGAWAGTAIGIGAAAGWAIGSAIGSVVEASFAPKTAPQNTLADLSVQTANWGAGLPKIYGTQRVAGNIIWSTDKRMMGGSQGKFGGKGGGGGKSGGKKGGGQQAYYEVSLAIALAEGQVYGIKRIWAAGDLIFDDSAPTYVPNHGQTGGSYQQFGSTNYGDYSTGGSSLGTWTLYHGTQTQTPDATIVANGSNVGTNGVPYQQMTMQNGHEYTYGSPAFGKLGTACAYRGVAYIVFPNLYIAEGGTIPPLTFELVAQGAPNPMSFTEPRRIIASPGASSCDMSPDGVFAVVSRATYVNGAYLPELMYNTVTGAKTLINNVMFVSANGGSVAPNAVRNDGKSFIWGYGAGVNFGKSPLSVGGMADTKITGSLTYATCATNIAGNVFFFNGGYGGAYSPSFTAGQNSYNKNYLTTQSFPTLAPNNYQFNYQNSLPVIGDRAYYTDATNGILVYFDKNGANGYIGAAGNVPAGYCPIFTDGTMLWMVDGSKYLWKIDPSTGIGVKTVLLQANAAVYNIPSFIWDRGYLIGFFTDGTFKKFNADGSVRYSIASGFSGNINVFPCPQGIWVLSPNDYAADLGVVRSNAAVLALLNPGDDQVLPVTPTLPAVVADVCKRAQFINFDASQLPQTITVSMTIPAGSPARDVLAYLSKIYQFDMVDSAGLLKFVPKGQAISAVVPIDDIGFVKESVTTPPAPYLFSRAQGSDLPRSVTLKYMSRLANYTQNIRQFHINNPTGKDITASVPMTLDDLTAANAAMLLCISPHIEKTAYSWSTSLKYLWVEPGDVLQMPWGVTRVTQIAIDDAQQTPVIKMQGVIDATYVINNGYGMAEAVPVPELGTLPVQPAALASGAGSIISAPGSGSSGGNNGTLNKPPLNPGSAYGVFLEVPPLNSKQTSPFYLAYCYSTGSVFMGAAVFESTDGGSTFDQIGQQAFGGTSGFILEQIPATQEFTWDTSTTLSAYLAAPYMTLSGATDLQVMNGANLMKVGDELIQFANATLMTDANGVPYYQLSRLLRGRRGTEWAMASHIAGEQFTLIVDNEDVSIPYALTDLNNSNQYKVATAIQDISQVVPQEFAPTGVWFKPWSVANPLLSKDTSNNWNLSFTPRARLNGYLSSGVISSLDPDTQTFSIDIYNGTTLKRTVTGQLSSPSFQYTAAMQAADGFAAGASGIKFNIYQVGSQIGRGYVKTVTS